MRIIFTFLAGTLILLSSCSSVNKARQTPDDVYYSPGAPKQGYATAADNQDEYYSTAPSDRYVRMKSVDQARWSYFDDYNAYDSYYAPVRLRSYYVFVYPLSFAGYSSLILCVG